MTKIVVTVTMSIQGDPDKINKTAMIEFLRIKLNTTADIEIIFVNGTAKRAGTLGNKSEGRNITKNAED